MTHLWVRAAGEPPKPQTISNSILLSAFVRFALRAGKGRLKGHRFRKGQVQCKPWDGVLPAAQRAFRVLRGWRRQVPPRR